MIDNLVPLGDEQLAGSEPDKEDRTVTQFIRIACKGFNWIYGQNVNPRTGLRQHYLVKADKDGLPTEKIYSGRTRHEILGFINGYNHALVYAKTPVKQVMRDQNGREIFNTI